MLITVLIGALTVTTLLALAVGAVLVDHRRAQAGADLSALAGAVALQEGADACAAAGRLARANGVTLESCATSGASVLVEVVLESRFAGLAGPVRGRARAGPAS